MDTLLICRDALANSLVGNLVVAMEAKKAGMDVGVVFTQGALNVACGNGVFNWSPGLTGQVNRYKMADNAATLGLPTTGRGDSRQIDVKQLIPKAVEAGVPMFACSAWIGLLGLAGKLPDGMKEVDMPTLFKMVQEAKVVIGSL